MSDKFDVLFPKQLEINGFEMLPIKIAHLSRFNGLTVKAALNGEEIVIAQDEKVRRETRTDFNC